MAVRTTVMTTKRVWSPFFVKRMHNCQEELILKAKIRPGFVSSATYIGGETVTENMLLISFSEWKNLRDWSEWEESHDRREILDNFWNISEGQMDVKTTILHSLSSVNYALL